MRLCGSATAGAWGKYYSANKRAYIYDKTGKHFYRWNGSYKHTWSERNIRKLYTCTCWCAAGKYCGPVHRIY